MAITIIIILCLCIRYSKSTSLIFTFVFHFNILVEHHSIIINALLYCSRPPDPLFRTCFNSIQNHNLYNYYMLATVVSTLTLV